MNDIMRLQEVLAGILNQQPPVSAPLKLFSIEGLPGAGKTTQIKLVSEELRKDYGEVCYIDLPTQSPFGKILRVLYSDKAQWDCLRRSAPWFNLVFLSADLRAAIDCALEKKSACALMSRGILSTYYYNLDSWSDREEDAAWELMAKYMNSFYVPTAIFFLEVTETEAHKRVLKRNREPLREMDGLEQMRSDYSKLLRYLSRFSEIPVHRISGMESPAVITQKILERIKIYLAS